MSPSSRRTVLGAIGVAGALTTVGVLLAAASPSSSAKVGAGVLPTADMLRCPTCRYYAWDARLHRPVRWDGGWHHPACPLLRALGAGAARRATRPSCLECVDKHLGAAWVLIAETRDGYPHRLRAIGHLHEAEDESQEYPELHEAIRRARKRYQQDDVCPDFARLEAMVTRRRG